MTWDPEQAPDPEQWLALDEQERIAQITEWHEIHPQPALHPTHMNVALHAGFHAVAEAQIAANEPPITRETLDRLMADGLRRHPALHLVMRVLVEHLHEAMTEGRSFDEARYARALRGLRAEEAVEVGGLGRMVDAERDEAPNRAARRRKKRRRK